MSLVDKIKGFDFDLASTADQMALAKALRILADDTLVRHTKVVEMQGMLAQQIAVAGVAAELAGVCVALRTHPRPTLVSRLLRRH